MALGYVSLAGVFVVGQVGKGHIYGAVSAALQYVASLEGG